MSTPTPSQRSAPRSTLIPRVDSAIAVRDRQYLPIFGNLPPITASDPYGLLPYRRRIQTTKSCVLEWDNVNKCLQAWFWCVLPFLFNDCNNRTLISLSRPVEDGQRVAPSEFNEYRRSHDFRNPACLCSAHELDPNHVAESAVFMVRSGTLSGEYVAACARGVCKYWGESFLAIILLVLSFFP